jgi:hypothetical protein
VKTTTKRNHKTQRLKCSSNHNWSFRNQLSQTRLLRKHSSRFSKHQHWNNKIHQNTNVSYPSSLKRCSCAHRQTRRDNWLKIAQNKFQGQSRQKSARVRCLSCWKLQEVQCERRARRHLHLQMRNFLNIVINWQSVTRKSVHSKSTFLIRLLTWIDFFLLFLTLTHIHYLVWWDCLRLSN